MAESDKNCDLVDLYDKAINRIAVLANFLNQEIVHSEPVEYDYLVIAAVDFLHEEIFDCLAAQRKIRGQE